MGQAQQNRRAVLIVEDDAELRELAARLLEDGELDTIECESAEAALNSVSSEPGAGQTVASIRLADFRWPVQNYSQGSHRHPLHLANG
jgi:CheY-like chemotaxis protein